jgi:hypothetical protein
LSIVSFTISYIKALANLWFAFAGLLLTFADVLTKLVIGRSWDWQSRHRFKIAMTVLVAAQVGAYKSLYDNSNQRITVLTKEHHDIETRLRDVTNAVVDKDRRIATLVRLC